MSSEQSHLLNEHAYKFRTVLVMMDNKTSMGTVDSMRMAQSLAFLPNVKTCRVPFGKGDGAELTPNEVKEWAYRLTK
jgi:hypothetical protein